MSDWSEEVGGRRGSAWVLPLQILCPNCQAAIGEYCTVTTALSTYRRHIPCHLRTMKAAAA
jgi:hypothetical protein